MRFSLFGILLLFSFHAVFAQANNAGLTVSVLDEHFQPLPGVNVYAGEDFGGSTDIDGHIDLPSDKIHRVFEFSFLGYETVSLTFFDIRRLGAKVRLVPAQQLIQEVVVVGRTDARKEEIPYQVEKISSEDIAFLNPQTTAHAMEASGQVFVQRSQAGGGSPVLRGFEANKVLLVVDGVRMNNAIYRSGHLQNAITIDNSALDKMEIIFGPGSLMYGSDALGGVIHFRTRRPSILTKDDLAYQRTNAAGYLRFATANYEKTAHIDFDYARHKFGMFTSLSFSNFGDLRTGSVRLDSYPDFGKQFYYVDRVNNSDQVIKNFDPNIIPKSAYQQMDLLNKLRFQVTNKLEFGLNFQISNSSNISRNDKLVLTKGAPDRLTYSEWYYGPQLRFLTAFHTKWVGKNLLFNKVKGIVSYQRINEDRLTRKFAKAQRSFQFEDVSVYSTTLDFEKWLNKRSTFKFLYGGELNVNNVFSHAGKLDISTNFVTGDKLTRYPSQGSKMISKGSYGILQLQSRDTVFTVNGGIRYSIIDLAARYNKDDFFTWPRTFYEGLSNHNKALTWGLGATINTKSGFQLRTLVSTAFRAPNLDDFAKIREKNGFITVPNPDVRPENSKQVEFTIGQFFRKRAYFHSGQTGFAANIYLTAFQTNLTDAIVVDTFHAPDNSTEICDDDECYRTTASINADSAKIRGISLNGQFYLGTKWTLNGSWSITEGFILKDGGQSPLAHIPPPYGKIGLSYKSKRFQVSGNIRFNGFKPIDQFGPGTSDNAKNTYKEGALPWHTFNIHSSLNLGKNYSVQIGVENIADLHYRPFASNISAPGRNFIISLRKGFVKARK
ncbi:MAG TPA: hypothetical protein ENK85_00520 [Saprospiraceae bacterium]|nr:hypothetical protein [Saprospiraceae bacterium]